MLKRITTLPFLYPTILVALCLLIAFKNYTPGTYLTGWDTLHPEFDFTTNFSRLIYGVWRSEQGLGAVSGHSAMADLPRVIILWFFHFFLPLSFLRYSYIFLCLVIGPLGFYFLIKYLFHKQFLAFIGALIYLFNFGTLQQFYVPFEMFPTQWAFLPWIILYSLKYLQSPSTFRLLTFGLFTLFATPQAYAAHLWYPFFGVYIIFVVTYSLLHQTKIYPPLVLIVLTVFINSFWLLPNIYYAAAQTDNPRFNLTNRLHSQEFLLKNRQTGTLADTSLIKGFYFNWEQYDFANKSSQPLMSQWNNHLQNYDIRLIGELIFLFAFVGLIVSIVSKNSNLIPLAPFFIFPFILLANNMPLFKDLFSFLLKLPLLEEIFRFIFTKLSTLLTFGYAIFFTYFLQFLFETFPKSTKPIGFLIVISLIVYCFPYFNGQLISDVVRVKIPDDYFSVYKFFHTQPESRILTLPLHEPSGWAYYSWQYQGSGFLWFGIPQPVLDRDSDRWAYTNEEAYREFKTALYSKNTNQFLNTLHKYRIGYIFHDESIIPAFPKNIDEASFKAETKLLLNQLVVSQQIKSPMLIGNVSIYTVNQPIELVETKTITNYFGPSYRWHYIDFQNQYDYLTTNTSKDINLPFRSIFNNQNKIRPEALSPLHLNDFPQTLFSGSKVFSSLNSTQGTGINLDNLTHQVGYLIGIKSQYISGIPFRLCLKNNLTDLCAIEDETAKDKKTHWDYFLSPPQDEFFGYNLELNLISYGNQRSTSLLEGITISPVNFHLFENNSPTQPTTSYSASFTKIFPNNSLLKVNYNSVPTNSTLILHQSFSPGWLVFYFDGLRPVFLKDHVLINNWANGWKLTSDNLTSEIYILFWPQLLEFLGFGLLIGTFIWVLKLKH